MRWHLAPAEMPDRLGLLPWFFSLDDPRGAVEQLNDRYAHGGGFRPFDGFSLDDRDPDPFHWKLSYPGDPTFTPLAYVRFREETLVLFPYDWLLIHTPQYWQIARID